MNDIKLKNWLIGAGIILALSLLADYYFIHILFQEKSERLEAPAKELTAHSSPAEISVENTATPSQEASSGPENFLPVFQQCLPEIAAQAIATPEALIEYLKKSVGVAEEIKDIENYHIKLADGSERRIHIIGDDNTNSTTKKEIRFFKLDEEGYPERIPLGPEDNLESLLKQGELSYSDNKGRWVLKDQSVLSLETRNARIFEFQYQGLNHTLSCRGMHCRCQ